MKKYTFYELFEEKKMKIQIGHNGSLDLRFQEGIKMKVSFTEDGDPKMYLASCDLKPGEEYSVPDLICLAFLAKNGTHGEISRLR